MRVDQTLIAYLKAAVIEIHATNYSTWAMLHGGDLFFKKADTILHSDMESTWTPSLSFPPRDYTHTIDDFCTWILAHNLNYTEQNIPSTYDQIYRLQAEPERADGAIRKRYPWHLNYKQTSTQDFIRAAFKRACNCFSYAPETGGVTPPGEGPRSRDWWYAYALSEGTWYYTQFMKDTLAHYYAEAAGDFKKLPYTSEPDWCKWLDYAEAWTITPVFGNEAIFAIINNPITIGYIISEISILAEGDTALGNPGNPANLNITFYSQALDEDGEPVSDLVKQTITGIGTNWKRFSVICNTSALMAQIYIAIEVGGENKDFVLFIKNGRNYKFGRHDYFDTLGIPDNSFAFDIAGGNWNFRGFEKT